MSPQVTGEVEGNTGLDYSAGNGNVKEKIETRKAGDENVIRNYLSSKSQGQGR